MRTQGRCPTAQTPRFPPTKQQNAELVRGKTGNHLGSRGWEWFASDRHRRGQRTGPGERAAGHFRPCGARLTACRWPGVPPQAFPVEFPSGKDRKEGIRRVERTKHGQGHWANVLRTSGQRQRKSCPHPWAPKPAQTTSHQHRRHGAGTSHTRAPPASFLGETLMGGPAKDGAAGLGPGRGRGSSCTQMSTRSSCVCPSRSELVSPCSHKTLSPPPQMR